jgi:uncharacterized membrane protein YhiD involved in acid resistance
MIESFLEGTLYYDFPSFEVAIFSLLLAFVLSTFLALTYQFTYRGNSFPNSFFQAMILSSIVTSMIMMAVGSDLAVGFGIIGAVAIIRFRTMIRNPRNIIYMFGAISIGIATGVYGYEIAAAGTIIFSVITILLFYSRYRVVELDQYEVILIHHKLQDPLESLLAPYCEKIELIAQKKLSDLNLRTEFMVNLKDEFVSQDLFEHLEEKDDLVEIRIEKQANPPL